ncbi:chondroitinase-B domain-containing protein [Paucimonas lemoignei]|nr:chondroitinase-B domain-containing protein [Paucimonas lemoignei]
MMLLLAFAIGHLKIAPRSLGPYLERRSLGHHALIEKSGRWLSQTLVTLDRGEQLPFALPPLTLGAQHASSATAPAVAGKGEREVIVDSPASARAAIEGARPGDVITFLSGTYYFDGRSIQARQAGMPDKPITVRAQHAGKVVLHFAITEGFKVSKPYWIFEGLTIRGVCKAHAECEHAFHVVGEASHFIARNNVVEDFNSHFKVNGEAGIYPDQGIIEANTLTNAGVRQTSNPVTPIDMVGASDWKIQRNLITDFVKGDGNLVSYGAFAKGAGSGNRFEKNIVLCEHRLREFPGQRVGLSFGGGGTGTQFCRDRRCLTEHDGGSINDNLIAFCSDDGIYLNKSATARVTHNTLLDTAGITVRFAVSSADLEGNLVDGIIRSRDDGVVRDADNLVGGIYGSYLGWHAMRKLYRQPSELDLAWQGKVPRRRPAAVDAIDLCNGKRAARAAYGAFEDFAGCRQETAKAH